MRIRNPDKKSKISHKTVGRYHGFSYYFCLMIAGPGSESGSIPLNNGSGSRRPKNMWIRIRIRNTAIHCTIKDTLSHHLDSKYSTASRKRDVVNLGWLIAGSSSLSDRLERKRQNESTQMNTVDTRLQNSVLHCIAGNYTQVSGPRAISSICHRVTQTM